MLMMRAKIDEAFAVAIVQLSSEICSMKAQPKSNIKEIMLRKNVGNYLLMPDLNEQKSAV